jgi:hypothetical protein
VITPTEAVHPHRLRRHPLYFFFPNDDRKQHLVSAYKTIAKLLESNAGAQRLSTVFDDFVEIMALTFRNSFDRSGYDVRESRYLEIAGMYSREQLDRFGEAMAQVIQEMGREPADVLGRLYMELDLGNERLGQFYTPYDVATLIAGMVGDELAEKIARDGTAEAYEPACGASAFLIAITQDLHARGVDYHRRLFVTAEDVALQAVHMTYVHLSLLHVPAIVHHRNTLTQETFSSWPTLSFALNGWRFRTRRTATLVPKGPSS